MQTPWRWAVWIAAVACAAFRPGVDRIDRLLAARFWDVPSQWNAIADVAIRTGVVDAMVDGAPAVWRQASVLPVDRIGPVDGGLPSRVAVVTVSDLRRSRVTFLLPTYSVIGLLERSTSDPVLVTDETRGYKPLSHIWPLVAEDGRLQTLLTFAPLLSDPPMLGVFAYVALGRDDNELLFVCRMRSAPGPMWGELARVDVNADGALDLVLYAKGQRTVPPLATFTWDRRARRYLPDVSELGRRLISWWTTAPENRIAIPRSRPIDDVVLRLAVD